MTDGRKMDRTPRESQTREQSAAKKTWRPASLLPTPEPRDGLEFRYVRTSVVAQSDSKNVSAKFREGWTPVLAKDYPELMVMSDHDSRFPENIEIGGLLLCSNSKEMMDQRREYQAKKAEDQIVAVDNNYMREQDARMPLLRTERTTRVEFGGDKPSEK